MPGSRLALGRYEVTLDEYRAFASTTGGGAGGGCSTEGNGNSWQDPGFGQTHRHPVACVSWDDAQAYVSWLSQMAGASYRLPTEAEWYRSAAGSQRSCDRERTGTRATCTVGSYGANGAGLFDMVGNVWEWTEDCWEADCRRRVLRGGSWFSPASPGGPAGATQAVPATVPATSVSAWRERWVHRDKAPVSAGAKLGQPAACGVFGRHRDPDLGQPG